MAKIGFIGMGNMGTAILKGALREFPKEDMVFCARTLETKRRIYEKTGVEYTDSNAECANKCKYLILAVKPQFYEEVLKGIRYMLTPEHVILSLAPGVWMVYNESINKRRIFRFRAECNGKAVRGMRKGGICGGTAYGRSGLCERKLSGLCVHVH